MVQENISQEFRLKNRDETRNCFIEKVSQNELISNEQRKICTSLNYVEYLLILAYAITGCVSASAFTFLFGIPVGISSSVVGLKICAITAGI